MVCTWYIIVIYSIPSFQKPDFRVAAGPSCCWSHSIRTRVWVIKSLSVLFHAPPCQWQVRQPDSEGKRLPTKGSTRLPAAANVPLLSLVTVR